MRWQKREGSEGKVPKKERKREEEEEADKILYRGKMRWRRKGKNKESQTKETHIETHTERIKKLVRVLKYIT